MFLIISENFLLRIIAAMFYKQKYWKPNVDKLNARK